jgi:MFS family permease
VLFVAPAHGADAAVERPRPASLRGATSLLRIARYRSLLIAGGALSLATASDAFIFLTLQQRLDLGTSMFPLLFVGSSAIYMALAVPVGRLADRVGRGRVLIGGYVLLLGVYASLLLPTADGLVLVAALGMLGAFYAATDGVLMALGSTVVPGDVRATGLALLGTVTSLGRLVASLLFGALWTLWGTHAAVTCFAAGLAAATVVASLLIRRANDERTVS